MTSTVMNRTGGARSKSAPAARGVLGILSLLGLCLAILALAALPGAAQAATAYDHVGELAGPGHLSPDPAPQRIAVHEQSGKLFVADRGNDRVLVFDPVHPGDAGDPCDQPCGEPAFEIDVPQPIAVAVDQQSGDLYVTRAAVNELQELRIENTDEGTYTYTLEFEGHTTDPILFHASTFQTQAPLEALPSIGSGNIRVFGGGFCSHLGFDECVRSVEFRNDLGGTDVSEIVPDGSELNPGASIQVTTIVDGEPGEVRKLNPNDSSDPTSYTPDPDFESPPMGEDPGAGEIGSFRSGSGQTNPLGGGIAVDPISGDILVADPGHDYVHRYEAGGWDAGAGHLGSFDGSSSGEPFNALRDIAVDSDGDLIATDSLGSQEVRILRFDGSGAFGGELPQPDEVPDFPGANGPVVAVNLATDEVFVGIGRFPAVVWQYEEDEFVTENRPTLPGLEDRFDGRIFGIAVRGADPGGRLYALASPGGGGTPRVQAFDDVGELPDGPPVPQIDPVDPDGVSPSGAFLTGTVTHDGHETSWRFEYGPAGSDPSTWQRVPVPDGAIEADDPDPFDVAETVSGLEPNTAYEVRLRAENRRAPQATGSVDFTTDPAPPESTTGQAHSVSAFRATLSGTVNPRNSETEFHFEWGTDETYGNLTEAEAVESVGNSPVQVTAEIDGLDPATTYHFRLVATNVEHPEAELGHQGADASFQTRSAAASALPERGYELVSRVDGRLSVPVGIRASEDGDAYVYSSWVPTPGAENARNTVERMTRGPDGSWSPDPHLPTPPVDPVPSGLGDSGAGLFSADLSIGMFHTAGSYHPLDQNRDADASGNDGMDIYLRSTETGDLTWLSRDPHDDDPQTDPTPARTAMYLSPDGELAIFQSDRRLLDSHDPATGTALYKWHSGELTHVSLGPGGQNVGGAELGDRSLKRNAVSPEGSRVVFDGGPLYVRIDDERTVPVGGGDDPGGGSASYMGADIDTTEILYLRGGALYLFDVEAEASVEIAASAGAVFGFADDMNRIYFRSSAELAPGAVAGERNLYLAERPGPGEDHEIGFVAGPLHPDDRRGGTPASDNDTDTDSEASILAFTSRAELVPGRRNGGFAQVYVYEAGIDRLYCASCPPDGSVPSGRSDVGTKTANGDWGLNLQASTRMPAYHNVTESGSVFFQSSARVLPEVANDAVDTYEWRGGEVRLISSGQGRRDEPFRDASADGQTVFFESMHDWVDHGGVSGAYRVYAARIGGGLVAPEPEADCVGEECRGEASSEPAPSIGSSELRREAREPDRAGHAAALAARCQRIVRHAKASRARAIALVRVARRSQGARRAASAKRARAFAQRSRVLRAHANRCRRALR